jgi:hypothetical protein
MVHFCLANDGSYCSFSDSEIIHPVNLIMYFIFIYLIKQSMHTPLSSSDVQIRLWKKEQNDFFFQQQDRKTKLIVSQFDILHVTSVNSSALFTVI